MTFNDLAVARVMCDDSLLFFTRFFFKSLRGTKFIVNWHHEKICESLQRVKRYETLFLNINIPPRHTKTELAINFIAQSLGENPRANFLYITASDELRSETSVRIRDIVSHEYFQKMYGVELKKDQTAKNLWRTNAGGGLKTATIFGQITGFGAGQMVQFNDDVFDLIRNFEGCIVLDDIDKIHDAEKGNANNKKTHSILFNTILSRKNSTDTPIINIQQRAGEDDSTSVLCAYFSKILGDKFESLVLPVLYEGRPLWPFKMGLAEIEGLKNSPETAHVFETQYMQNPTSPNGKPFHKSILKRFDESELGEILKRSEGCVSYVDSKDEGADYYCHVFAHVIGSEFYITDVVYNNHNTDITIPKSVELMLKNNCQHTVVETNAMGSMVFKMIRDRSGLRTVGLHNTANKETRIVMSETIIKNNFRFLANPARGSEYENYINAMSSFEYGRSGGVDDAPDATAGLASLIFVKFRHLFVENQTQAV